MKLQRTIQLPPFTMVGKYCDSISDMERTCGTLPFLLGNRSVDTDNDFSFGTGRNGIYFAGIKVQGLTSLWNDMPQGFSRRVILGGPYRVTLPMDIESGPFLQHSPTPWRPFTFGKRDIVYEFSRNGDTYEYHCIYIPLETHQHDHTFRRRLSRHLHLWRSRPDNHSQSNIALKPTLDSAIHHMVL
ncbi:hypothetical protein [Paenibacillus apiarius]|uniref:Uncharacterized protein n=1 Tax=Paenibacillus apiarius TaxID=46240 RepID=A0ABT4DMJ3_9BACL|nr:hypothetical protein [Paenibacillus apiarius]MCY9514581.1 hypothetical protein [Paenibacillus apiarius]MCY9518571.1 hypothetical protein [Paenibacillus apiarius]MCY9552659.1 hypothetical protein [Paenibacillus apiarius]MCY9557013.1 hypothetical protein [Paenibacillus apiarius]MCY9686034.1 hypothetical protein [Paenibacillus apiarius]